MTGLESLLIFSLVLSFVISVIYRVLTKPEEIRRIKQDLKFFRNKIKDAQKAENTAEVQKLTNEMLRMSQKQMSMMMKPMLVSAIIFFVALGWLHSTFEELVVALPFPLPFLGAELTWFWWYVIITLPATIIFRKALGVE